MKAKIAKLSLVSGIAYASGDPVIASMIALTYVFAEVASFMAVKAIRRAYTNKLLQSGVLYK